MAKDLLLRAGQSKALFHLCHPKHLSTISAKEPQTFAIPLRVNGLMWKKIISRKLPLKSFCSGINLKAKDPDGLPGYLIFNNDSSLHEDFKYRLSIKILVNEVTFFSS